MSIELISFIISVLVLYFIRNKILLLKNAMASIESMSNILIKQHISTCNIKNTTIAHLIREIVCKEILFQSLKNEKIIDASILIEVSVNDSAQEIEIKINKNNEIKLEKSIDIHMYNEDLTNKLKEIIKEIE